MDTKRGNTILIAFLLVFGALLVGGGIYGIIRLDNGKQNNQEQARTSLYDSSLDDIGMLTSDVPTWASLNNAWLDSEPETGSSPLIMTHPSATVASKAAATGAPTAPPTETPSEVSTEPPTEPEKTTEEVTEKKTEEPVFLQVGDIITFGSYPQEADGTVKPIEWQVLAVEDGKALIISLYGLDAIRYNEKNEDVSWETCTLRAWLNGEFYQTAFQVSEQKKIAETLVINKDNPTYGTPGGNDTWDKIFLLSLEETLQYFELTKNSGEYDKWVYCYGDQVCCRPTDYAISRGAWQYKWSSSDSEEYRKYDGDAGLWLRSPGGVSSSAANVGLGGMVYGGGMGSDGSDVDSNHVSVRPALWINP